MQKNPAQTREVAPSHDKLNMLMEAVALMIARRQMAQYWPMPYRETMTSI